MAVFQRKDPETELLPVWARGHGITLTNTVKVAQKNGPPTEYTVDGSQQFTVTNARDIRILQANTARYTQIS